MATTAATSTSHAKRDDNSTESSPEIGSGGLPLTDRNYELAYLWLTTNIESKPKATELLAWRIGTSELHWEYKKWCSQSSATPVGLEALWGIIQIAYPWVTIVGKQGNRAFTAIRRKACWK